MAKDCRTWQGMAGASCQNWGECYAMSWFFVIYRLWFRGFRQEINDGTFWATLRSLNSDGHLLGLGSSHCESGCLQIRMDSLAETIQAAALVLGKTPTSAWRPGSAENPLKWSLIKSHELRLWNMLCMRTRAILWFVVAFLVRPERDPFWGDMGIVSLGVQKCQLNNQTQGRVRHMKQIRFVSQPGKTGYRSHLSASHLVGLLTVLM